MRELFGGTNSVNIVEQEVTTVVQTAVRESSRESFVTALKAAQTLQLKQHTEG